MSASVAREELGYATLNEIASEAKDEPAFLELRDEHRRALRCLRDGRAIGWTTEARLAVHDLRRFGFIAGGADAWKLTPKGVKEAEKAPAKTPPAVDPVTAAAREILAAMLAFRMAAHIMCRTLSNAEGEKRLDKALEHLGYGTCALCGGTNRADRPDGHGETAVDICGARGCVGGLVKR